MATISTSQTFDSATRTANETYTINSGAIFTIDTHTRYNAGVSSLSGAAGLGSFTMTAATGGEVFIDGSKVKMVAFSGGSGNVPAYNANIVQGSVTGVFLAVLTAINAVPILPGAAMPASGFIMFKSVSGGSFAAGAITSGMTATVVGTEKPGFLEIVGCDASGATIGRTQKWKHRMQWFSPFDTSGNLITTSGSAGQQIQLPNFGGANRFYPGIWVEDSAGSDTYTFWPAFLAGTGSPWTTTNLGTTARNRFVQCLAGGIVRFGSDGTNSIGAVPASGCKVRIPNILLGSCAATPTASDTVPNATLATRFDFTVTNAGQIDIEGFIGHWNINLGQAYSVKLNNFAHFDLLTITECATAIDLNNGGTGLYSNIGTDANNFVLTSNFAGGTVIDCKFGRSGTIGSADYGTNVSYCNNITFTRCEFQNRALRSNAAALTARFFYCGGLSFTDCASIGSGLMIDVCSNTTFNNHGYCDLYTATSSGTNPPLGAIYIQNGSSNTLVNGWRWYDNLDNVHPDTAILYLNNAINVKARNIGTFASKLSAGSSNAMLYFCNDAGNSLNIEFKRIYFDLIATTFYNSVNSSKNVEITNCEGNTTVYKNTVSAALNRIIKNSGMAGIAPASTASIYGSIFYHHFTSASAGRLGLVFSEPTAEYAPYVTTNFTSSATGTSGFNSTNGLALINSGDYAIFEFPFTIKGIDNFQNSAPTITTSTNMTIEFQIDTGSGWNGTWLTFNATNLSGQTVDEVAGFKFKIRCTANATSASNILTVLYALTSSNATAQAIQYPLDTVTLTLTGIVTGSDVVIYQAGTTTVRQNTDSITGTTNTYTYETTENIDIGVFKSGYVPFFIRNYALGTSNTGLPIAQVIDRAYLE